MKPHIAVIAVGDFPSRRGGFDSFISGFAPRAADLCAMSVYCEAEDQLAPHASQVSGVERIAIYRKPGYLGLAAHRTLCIQHALDQGADAIFLLGATMAPVVILRTAWRRGVRVVINPDGLEWRRSGYRWWERSFYLSASLIAELGADVLVCDSEAIAHRYQRLRGKRPTVFMPYAVSVPERSESWQQNSAEEGVHPGDYYLMVGRCVRENHMLDVAQWWPSMPTHRRLVIVTDTEHVPTSGRYFARALSAAARNAPGKIQLVGPVYDEGKLNRLRTGAFAYIHGHSVGGTNPSLLEGMACRRPIIAHDNEFNREVLGSAGLFFLDRTTLSSALSCLERSEMDASELGILAGIRVQELYSWNRVMEIFERQVVTPLVRHLTETRR